MPAQSDWMQTLIFSIGIVAIVLFALALLLERWSREPTGLELIEWQKQQDSVQPRPVRDAARAMVRKAAVPVIRMLAAARAQAAIMSEQLHHAAVKHGMSLALLAGIAKAALLRRLASAGRT